MHPKFYKKDRHFLVDMCQKLQEFYYNDDEFMLMNLPPRHGKSFSATNYIEWILGQNPLEKIMSASYSHDLSKTFSKKIRSTIDTEKIGDNIVYSDIFDTKIKFGSAEAMKWQTEQSSQINYLATSPSGTATGFGCSFMVIDDLVKNAYEANNERILEQHFDWFVNTMLSRREGKKKVLVIMTRWSSRDLAGKLLEFLNDNNISYTHVNYKAELDNGTMLCEEIFSKVAAERAKIMMGEDIYEANYNQEPIDSKGCLYTNLMTYDKLPEIITTIDNYTDTADKGKDFLCSINYAVDKDNYAYIIDVLYTQESMETTEIKVADMLINDKVNFAHIESNNGGRGFARNVERIMREKGSRHTRVKPFHQTKNKEARILTGSTGVMQNIYFPADWKRKWPKFYKDVTQFQRAGDNEHDDSVDTLTGIYEKINRSKSRMNVGRL